jgi:hypothetical protein
MAGEEADDDEVLIEEFHKALDDCAQVYRTCGREAARAQTGLDEEGRQEFVGRMADLARGLMFKVFVEVGYVHHRWSEEAIMLAIELFDHVYHKQLNDRQVKEALAHFREEDDLTLDVLLGPFDHYPEFRARAAQLQSVVLRLANLVAKADGHVDAQEVRQLQWLQAQLERLLVKIPVDTEEEEPRRGKIQKARKPAELGIPGLKGASKVQEESEVMEAEAVPTLEESMAELDTLVGIQNVKDDVRGLVNFLKMQQARQEFDLPQTSISLHSVFSGNPGTGKTTVARLLGNIFGAMGILTRGHLVETDRSGLVAEYSGQTAPKAHKKIDEALDGVLFIDEAYSLVAEEGDDPYGAEALQVLLKRMEDNRTRLIVVLAGYPEPLDRLIKSNPGLSSRFSRMFKFKDYTASELGRIFQGFCSKNRYVLPPLTRVKLQLGFRHLLLKSDEHFGNARLARNVFERAIGRLANRISSKAPITKELLSTLQPEDIEMDDVPAEVWKDLQSETRTFHIVCPGCKHESQLPQKYLGHRMHCKHCEECFEADWGEIVG